nr:hypothetical protein [Tanacetum cinerariifolium]
DLSRAPYSRRTKVKLPECKDIVYALGDETSFIFPWGNNDIAVFIVKSIRFEGRWLPFRRTGNYYFYPRLLLLFYYRIVRIKSLQGVTAVQEVIINGDSPVPEPPAVGTVVPPKTEV